MEDPEELGRHLPALAPRGSSVDSLGFSPAPNRHYEPGTDHQASQRPSSLVPKPLVFHGGATMQQTALPPGAIKRRAILAQRKNERDLWRLDRSHQLAVRDPEGIVLPGLSLSRIKIEPEPDEEAGVVITARTRWRLLNEGFREADERRDGTVSNNKFVSLLRLLDLDLGEEATLELLRKYNRTGRADYLSFLHNIKRLLFPRGVHEHDTSAADGDKSGKEVADTSAPAEPDQQTHEQDDDDDEVLDGLRFKVAQVWGQWRQNADKDEEALFLGTAGASSLEGQLVLQRLVQRLQRCLSQAEMAVLVRGYHKWTRAAGGAGEGEEGGGSGGAGVERRRGGGRGREKVSVGWHRGVGVLRDQQCRQEQSEKEQQRRLAAKRQEAGGARTWTRVVGGSRTWADFIREFILGGAEDLVHQHGEPIKNRSRLARRNREERRGRGEQGRKADRHGWQDGRRLGGWESAGPGNRQSIEGLGLVQVDAATGGFSDFNLSGFGGRMGAQSVDVIDGLRGGPEEWDALPEALSVQSGIQAGSIPDPGTVTHAQASQVPNWSQAGRGGGVHVGPARSHVGSRVGTTAGGERELSTPLNAQWVQPSGTWRKKLLGQANRRKKSNGM